MPKAMFYRKETNLRDIMPTEEYEITETVVLPENEFQEFMNNPLQGYLWIAQAKSGSTIRKENGSYVTRVLLVTKPSGGFGFLINSEGYDYPRYIAYIELPETKEEPKQ